MNLRKYGAGPYKVAVVHGGPGAAGSVRSLCVELSKDQSILEPLQTAMSVKGQLEELRQVLEENTDNPVTLVGHSWGAMLIYMLAAKYHHLVKKIILISSGSFEEKYYEDLCKNRDSRLTAEEKEELGRLRRLFANPGSEDMDKVFSRFGELMDKLDSYELIEAVHDDSLYSYETFVKVWPDSHAMRKSGEMFELGKNIKCEVVAIHGDYDSHPGIGVKSSLEKLMKDYRFYELEKCGHTPWEELHAKEEFYRILRSELNS